MVDWIDFLQAFWQGLLQGRLPQLGVWTYLLLGFLIVLQGPLATLLGGWQYEQQTAVADIDSEMRRWGVLQG